MYLVWINPPINFTFSDDSVFLKKNLGGGHKFSEFACFIINGCNRLYGQYKSPGKVNTVDCVCINFEKNTVYIESILCKEKSPNFRFLFHRETALCKNPKKDMH